MNDFELESKLKSLRVPERTEEYWENFPTRVRSKLRPVFVKRPRKIFLPQFAWGGAIAVACLFFILALFPAFQAVLKNEKSFQRELAQLPDHLRVFMADEHGMHYLIADQQ
ncbi:MAG: hypothetical protein ACREFE_10855 [Limisphaerales bacterium]